MGYIELSRHVTWQLCGCEMRQPEMPQAWVVYFLAKNADDCCIDSRSLYALRCWGT